MVDDRNEAAFGLRLDLCLLLRVQMPSDDSLGRAVPLYSTGQQAAVWCLLAVFLVDPNDVRDH